ncbi:hypothetical protein M0R45_030957 [Rubus argutus]|uniref:MHC class I antigen n=1 Tax=Rubus argutus TaxID=59490 RepID=A0AAW1WEM8_RUBAR
MASGSGFVVVGTGKSDDGAFAAVRQEQTRHGDALQWRCGQGAATGQMEAVRRQRTQAELGSSWARRRCRLGWALRRQQLGQIGEGSTTVLWSRSWLFNY